MLSKFRSIAFAAIVSLALSVTASASLPPLLDLDVNLTASGDDPVTTNQWKTVVSEGWLHLKQVGTSASYTGTLTDNLAGGNAIAASVNATTLSAPVITIHSRFGRITFTGDSNFMSGGSSVGTKLTLPPALSTASGVYLFCNAHQYTTVTYALDFQVYVGLLGPRAHRDGTLSLITDTQGYIVPLDRYQGVHSTFSIPHQPHPLVTNLAGSGYFGKFDANGGAAGYVNLMVNCFGKYYGLGGAEDFSHFHSDPAPTYTGQVFASGAGTAGAIGTFSMTKQ